MLRKKLLRFKIKSCFFLGFFFFFLGGGGGGLLGFFLHFCISRSGAHDIFDARLGNSISRLGTLKIMLPDQDTNKIQVAY